MMFEHPFPLHFAWMSEPTCIVDLSYVFHYPLLSGVQVVILIWLLWHRKWIRYTDFGVISFEIISRLQCTLSSRTWRERTLLLIIIMESSAFSGFTGILQPIPSSLCMSFILIASFSDFVALLFVPVSYFVISHSPLKMIFSLICKFYFFMESF